LIAPWESRQLGKGLIGLLIGYFIANTLPRIPGLEALRDLGLATYAALSLWALACVIAWRRTRAFAPATNADCAATSVAA